MTRAVFGVLMTAKLANAGTIHKPFCEIWEKDLEDTKKPDRHESVKSISHAFQQSWGSHEVLQNLFWQNARSA
jgi:hypothetical protein